jgi:hypothetical protein
VSRILINGKEVDTTSLVVDGIDTKDAPDFCDAYFSEGRFTDGTELTDDELWMLGDDHGDLLYEKVAGSLW